MKKAVIILAPGHYYHSHNKDVDTNPINGTVIETHAYVFPSIHKADIFRKCVIKKYYKDAKVKVIN